MSLWSLKFYWKPTPARIELILRKWILIFHARGGDERYWIDVRLGLYKRIMNFA